MTTAHIFIATSMDGFIARADGTLDWLMNPAYNDDHGYDDFMASIDGLIMGRKSYESVLGFDIEYDRYCGCGDKEAHKGY